jgi:nucleoid-associated protein YgaU
MSKWQTIAKANPTVDPNLMKVGTKLRIPAAPTATDKAIASASIPAATKSSKSATAPSTGIASSNTGKSGSAVHVVAKGETLSSISKQHYGDSKLWKLIAKANPKIDANNLSVGAKLQIPPKAITTGENVTR